MVLYGQLLMAAFLIHRFSTDKSEMTRTVESMFMKNLSMGGGAIIVFVVTPTFDNMAFAITGSLFGS